MQKHVIGELLGKSLGEIDAMPRSEIDRWTAYIIIKNNNEHKRQKQEAAKARATSGRRR